MGSAGQGSVVWGVQDRAVWCRESREVWGEQEVWESRRCGRAGRCAVARAPQAVPVLFIFIVIISELLGLWLPIFPVL